MKLNVITPESRMEYHIAWLELETFSGSLTVYKGHAPAVFPVAPHTQLVFKLKTGKQQLLTVQCGVVHIDRATVDAIVTLTA